MKSVNPLVIPRNHKVEEALNAANQNDLKPFLKLLEILDNPYKKIKMPLNTKFLQLQKKNIKLFVELNLKNVRFWSCFFS